MILWEQAGLGLWQVETGKETDMEEEREMEEDDEKGEAEERRVLGE